MIEIFGAVAKKESNAILCLIGDGDLKEEMMKKIEKNHDFIFPKVKNDGRIVGRKTYGKVLIILRICNKGGTILDFSDVLIIIIVILALLCVGMYYLNKKGMIGC